MEAREHTLKDLLIFIFQGSKVRPGARNCGGARAAPSSIRNCKREHGNNGTLVRDAKLWVSISQTILENR